MQGVQHDGDWVAQPFVQEGGDGQWKAGLWLCGDHPRGERSARSLFTQAFPSRDAALHFADQQCRSLWSEGASR